MSTPQETYEPAIPEITQPKTAYVSYGLPFEQACVKHIDETFHASRVYVIASGGLTRSSDALARLQKALGSRLVAVHIGVAQHTPFTDVIKIAKEVREKEADCVLTLGGGSLSDAAKLVIFVAANPQHMSDIMPLYDPSISSFKDVAPHHREGINDPTMPIICVPTSLSAGEYSSFSGATDADHVKWQFYNPYINPDLVVLDPILVQSTPEWVWLSTGVRAMDHCTEALCNVAGHEVVDPVAIKALGDLADGLLRCKADPSDTAPRLECQLAARRAMLSLNMLVPIGASHGIGHMLGPLGVGHGVTSCILLPAVMRYNAPVNAHRQELVKGALWRRSAVVEVLTKAGLNKESSAGEMLGAVFDALGMPRTLKSVGVGRERFGELARASLKDVCLQMNPRRITEEGQVLEILDMVAGDQ